MTEQTIMAFAEKSLIGGAFLYMLHFFLGKFSTSLERFGENLKDVSDTLLQIKDELSQMDKRIERLENKEW